MILRIKTSRILHFFVLLSACIFSGIRANAQCDPSQKYDKLISGFHQTIGLKSDGTFAVWGQDMASNGSSDVLAPQSLNVSNYPGLTGTPLKATIGGNGGTSSEQFVVLTTTGLFAWGNEGFLLDAALTTGTNFQKIATPTGGDTNFKLPSSVAPTDVATLFGTYQTLAIVTTAGKVWVLTKAAASLQGNNAALAATTWQEVKINASTSLTGVVALRGQVSSSSYGSLMALTASGQVYAWGPSVYLGNGSASAAKSYATPMVLPSEFTNANLPKMIGVTGGIKGTSTVKNTFFLLSNTGSLYALGDNSQKQCGDFTTTERKTWVNAKINASTNYTNVNYITVQEHDASFPAVAVTTKNGDLYTWGENGGKMIGRTTDPGTYDPGYPLGFTSGSDIALSAEMGGHTLVYLKEGTSQFCYVGHRTNGSMGDGTSTSAFESTFNCSGTPSLDICGSVPVAASSTTSTISANPTSIVADGISTSTISIQLKDASGNNLTTSGGIVVVTTSDGTLGTVVDNNNGTYTVILTSSTNAGAATLGFSINGTTATNTTTVTFTAQSGGDTTPPVITGPADGVGGTTTGLNSDKTIPENITVVYTLTASEPVTWSITGGADQSKLSIDPNTGVVSFNSAPDYEIPTDADTNNTYIVIITATDAAGNSTIQTLTVTVTDVDEVPPVISGPNGSIGVSSTKSIPENTTAVHTFTANELVSWNINGGVDQALFTIDPATGAVSFVTAPDFENPTDSDGNNAYLVIIEATDADGNVSSQNLTVTVTDVDETAPVITGPTTGGGTTTGATSDKTVPENTISVYTFTANESVTWSLGGGADQARFTINPTSGLVSFSPAPDFENPTDSDVNNVYVVVIKATDAAGNFTTQTFTVTVTDVVENLAPTNITLSKMNVFEANAIGAVIGNLTTTDPDVGDTHTYTLVSGAGSTSNAYFTISGNQLKAGVVFNYIAQSTYSIRIRTTDAGGLPFEKVFTITISESPTVKGTGYNINTGITPATSNPVISKGYFSNLTVTGTNLVSYSWTPVLNLSNTNTANPTASPSQTKTYAVTVTNSFGSSTVLNITVTVVEDYNVTPRNAITPNGDGKNDAWVVANITSYPNNQVRIFDRAGRLLFVESNYQNGWDGTVNGVPLKEDTYYFVITFGPGVNPKKGFISIIR